MVIGYRPYLTIGKPEYRAKPAQTSSTEAGAAFCDLAQWPGAWRKIGELVQGRGAGIKRRKPKGEDGPLGLAKSCG